jgi:hypothetical protein
MIYVLIQTLSKMTSKSDTEGVDDWNSTLIDGWNSTLMNCVPSVEYRLVRAVPMENFYNSFQERDIQF